MLLLLLLPWLNDDNFDTFLREAYRLKKNTNTTQNIKQHITIAAIMPGVTVDDWGLEAEPAETGVAVTE